MNSTHGGSLHLKFKTISVTVNKSVQDLLNQDLSNQHLGSSAKPLCHCTSQTDNLVFLVHFTEDTVLRG